MKIADRLTLAGVVISTIAVIWGIYQYYDTKKENNRKLKIEDVEIERYYNSRFHFSINLPKKWIVHPNSPNSDGFKISHPYEDINILAFGAYARDDSTHDLSLTETFINYDFKSELQALKDDFESKIINLTRIEKYVRLKKRGKDWNMPIPAIWVIQGYYDKRKKINRTRMLLLIACSETSEYAIPVVILEAGIDCPNDVYEANKEFFSKIVLSLEYRK